jgi:hypothetical protein
LNTTQVKTDANTWLIRREFDSNTIYLHLSKMPRINRARAEFNGVRGDGRRGG